MSDSPLFKTVLADWKKDSHALMSVRETVFIREQNVPPELERDLNDANYIHVKAVLDDGRIIGTARLLPSGFIGRMAVLKKYRGLGVGSTLLQLLVNEGRRMEIKLICLNAQITAVEFYQKFGFIAEGEPFMEADIEHRKMCRCTV